MTMVVGLVNELLCGGISLCTKLTSFLKYSRSNMHSGSGKLYFDKLLYKPVPGVLKSGIPAEHDIPAPLNQIMFSHIPVRIRSIIPAKFNVSKGHFDLFTAYCTYGVIGDGPQAHDGAHPMNYCKD